MFNRKKTFPIFTTIIVVVLGILLTLVMAVYGLYKVLENDINGVVVKNDGKAEAASIIEMGKVLAGFEGERTYLVLLQNNHELRPTGGFIGQYAVVTVENGRLKEFISGDVGVLDTAAPTGVQVPRAPAALKTYLNQNFMFFRDANWNPDFKQAAAQIAQIYAIEKGERADRLDGVIAIDTSVLEEIVGQFGPVRVGDMTFTKDNAIDTLEYEIEVGYIERGIKKEHRKLIIQEMGEKLMANAIKTSPLKFPGLIRAGQKLAREKHIVMFDYDAGLQTWYEANGWAGTSDVTDTHFVQVVDANLNAFKTDRVVTRSFEHVMNQKGDTLTSALSMTYTNNGTKPDYRTKEYRSYTRLHLPKDATITGVEGVTHTQYGDPGYDDYIVQNKRIVGFFHKVNLGSSGTVSVTYETPIGADGLHLLYIKQPGTNESELTVDVSFDKQVSHNDGVDKISCKGAQTHCRFEGDLSVDRQFQLNFNE